MVGKLEILGNPRLQDISALEDALGCVGNRPTAVDAKAVLGAIEVIPEGAPSSTSCLINNAAQASKAPLPPPPPPSPPNLLRLARLLQDTYFQICTQADPSHI